MAELLVEQDLALAVEEEVSKEEAAEEEGDDRCLYESRSWPCSFAAAWLLAGGGSRFIQAMTV